MNYELSKKNLKGKEEVTITISPSDSLEREFFNQLFNWECVFQKTPNSDDIVIVKSKPTENAQETIFQK